MTNGYSVDIFTLISIFAVFCAISVIVSKNPIVSVLFLIGLFGSISSYLIIIGLTFIGLSYLIVYIGAVSILFLFILMLLNIRISELDSNPIDSISLGIIVIMLVNSIFYNVLPYTTKITNMGYYFTYEIYNIILRSINHVSSSTQSTQQDKIYYVTGTSWDGNLVEFSHITSIGNIMYTNYNIWLIMSSFILLLAMVGAIVITIKK
uniref:NADH dehydrogenase subunit 6 n=1 Tax=Pyricularia oryzae TaxID=318829 RepID=UPI0021B56D2A|nr:NADH dehydrogenase subunit 6 [Pyricularia oryzae]UWI54371.1 NADH dehydrogenase subunit 6 [Pyricularia oryzae]